MPITDTQLKVLEVLASGAMNATAILFTVVTVLVGMVAATGSRSDAREFRLAIGAAVFSVLVALAFAVLSISALSYRTTGFYSGVIVLGWLTTGVLAIAVVLLGITVVKR